MCVYSFKFLGRMDTHTFSFEKLQHLAAKADGVESWHWALYVAETRRPVLSFRVWACQSSFGEGAVLSCRTVAWPLGEAVSLDQR